MKKRFLLLLAFAFVVDARSVRPGKKDLPKVMQKEHYKVILIRHAEKENSMAEDLFVVKGYNKQGATFHKAQAHYKAFCESPGDKSCESVSPLVTEYKSIDAMLPLSRKGWERANALAAKLSGRPPVNFTNQIKTHPGYSQYTKSPNLLTNKFYDKPLFGKIDTIVAKGPKDDNGYVRTMQTVAPLAAALDLPVYTKVGTDELNPSAYEKLVKKIRKSGDVVLVAWEHHAIPYVAKALCGDRLPAKVFESLKAWPEDVFDQFWVFSFDQDHDLIEVENIGQRLLFDDSKDSMTKNTNKAIYQAITKKRRRH